MGGRRRVDSRVVAQQLQLLLLQLLHQTLLLKYKHRHSHRCNCTPIKGVEGQLLSSALLRINLVSVYFRTRIIS